MKAAEAYNNIKIAITMKNDCMVDRLIDASICIKKVINPPIITNVGIIVFLGWLRSPVGPP